MNHDDVTVVIPSIPARRDDYLQSALASVWAQEHPAAGLIVATDLHREGAWISRQRALDGVRTPWVAFLDDDDEFYPQHLRVLLQCAAEREADYVFSYWDLTRTGPVLGDTLGREFDPTAPHHTTMTVMVRTEIAQAVGFTAPPDGMIVAGEDWRFTLGCIERGARIVHHPEQTWYWRHHGKNTSGRPDPEYW